MGDIHSFSEILREVILLQKTLQDEQLQKVLKTLVGVSLFRATLHSGGTFPAWSRPPEDALSQE